MSHTCDAFVLCCIDFRFHQSIPALLKEQGINAYDLKADAGAVKYLVSKDKPSVRDWILDNIGIAERLHHIKKVVLINHYDCGAYGGNAVFKNDDEQGKFQTQQLRKAKALVSENFPNLEVIIFFAEFDGDAVSLRRID